MAALGVVIGRLYRVERAVERRYQRRDLARNPLAAVYGENARRFRKPQIVAMMRDLEVIPRDLIPP